jgi:hypothetical protein
VGKKRSSQIAHRRSGIIQEIHLKQRSKNKRRQKRIYRKRKAKVGKSRKKRAKCQTHLQT